MKELVITIGGVLLITLFVEILFRVLDRFSNESKIFFRWVYIIGLLALIIVIACGGWKDVVTLFSTKDGALYSSLLLVAVVVMTVLINRNERIK